MFERTLGFESSRAVPVALGVGLGGCLRMWQGDEPSLWRVADTAAFGEYTDLSCTGAISTDSYDAGLCRETATYDPVSSVVAVRNTVRVRDYGSTLGSALFMEVAPALRDVNGGDPSWAAVEQLLARAADEAQGRGDVVVVGAGPYPRVGGPSVLLGTRAWDARTLSVVSASPPPEVGRWCVSEPVDGRVTLLGTLSSSMRAEAASLAVGALREWGVEPFDVGIAFVVPIELLTHTKW